jgi:DnaJ like chaperone protein
MNAIKRSSKSRILGAVLCAGLGYLLARRMGLVLGLLLWAAWDQRALFFPGKHPDQDRFASTLFQLMGFLAKADGHVSPDEVAAGERFLDQLELQGERRAHAVESFNIGRSDGFDFAALIKAFNEKFELRSDDSQRMLAAVVAFAHADGAINAHEHEALKRISVALGFRSDELEKLQQQFMPKAAPLNEAALALQTLGLDANASDEDITRAYRRLISNVHPDKLEGKGIRGDALKGAESKAKAIRQAYDLLCTLRNIK